MKGLQRFPKLGFEGSVYLIFCSVLTTLLGLVLPFSILIIFDRVVPNSAESSLWFLFAIIVFSVIIDGVIKQAEQAFVSQQIERFESHITLGIFQSISHASLALYSKLSVGEYLERISMIHAVKNFFGGESIKASINVFTSLVTVIVICLIDFWAGFTVLAASTILFGFAARLSIKKQDTLALKSDAEGQTNSKILEIVSNPSNLKASAMEMRMENLMSNLVRRRESLSTSFEALESQFNLMLSLIQQISVSIVVVHCAISVINQDISQGVMAAVILLTNRYFAPYQQIMHTLSRWKVNKVYLERLTELLDLNEYENSGPTEEFVVHTLKVPQFKHDLEPGHLYAISGPSCSGKTFLAQSIARERDSDELSISVNGKPVTDIPYEQWRQQVIHIDRNSSFVEGTIIDNITCFQPTLHKAAYSLCEAMQIKNTIDELRQGFYTELKSTNTISLPRQVIYALAIIRALLSRKSIIIIDDLDLVYDAEFAKSLITCIRPRSDAFICLFISNRLHEVDDKLERIQLPKREVHALDQQLELKRGSKAETATSGASKVSA